MRYPLFDSSAQFARYVGAPLSDDPIIKLTAMAA
jgi:hypothetical protein